MVWIGLGRKSAGPTTVGFDNLVYLGHDANGFGQGDNDLVVVGDVFVGEDAVVHHSFCNLV